MAQAENVDWVGCVGYGKGTSVKTPQKDRGLGGGTGFEPKIGNLDKSTWKVPENKGWMTSFPTLGWESVDEEGRLPPGKVPFGKLPPGVTPAVSPLDRERHRFYGSVHTMSDGSYPANTTMFFRMWENIMSVNGWWFSHVPNKMREVYHHLQVFDSQPRYHIKLPVVTPLWDCHVNDVWCTAHADRRALIERRIDHNVVKILQTRLEVCHSNAVGEENKKTAKNFAFEYFCGDLDEAVKEAEAAYELKWGRLPMRRPEYQIGKMAYFKQKNRYIEDRFRHRMMENVGAAPNVDAFTVSGRNPRIVEGPDRTVHYAKSDNVYDVHEGWVKKWWTMTFGMLRKPIWYNRTHAHPKWDMDEALMLEAAKRKKMRAAAEED